MHLQEHLSFYPFLLSSSGRQLIEGFYFLAALQMPFNLPSFPHEWFSPVSPLLSPLFFFFSIDLDDANWWREEKPSASPHTAGEGGAEPEPPDLFTPGWNQVRQLMPSSGSAATCWRQTSPARPPECWEEESQPETYVGEGREGHTARETKTRELCSVQGEERQL